MAELEYRAAPNASAKLEVLNRLSDVVLCTAEFLADFPEKMSGTGSNGEWYDLGPPMVTASEGNGPYGVWDPTYELTQFNFSLDLAQSWLERLGKPRNPEWEEVSDDHGDRHTVFVCVCVRVRACVRVCVCVCVCACVCVVRWGCDFAVSSSVSADGIDRHSNTMLLFLHPTRNSHDKR
jgi:hypothetical protein